MIVDIIVTPNTVSLFLRVIHEDLPEDLNRKPQSTDSPRACNHVMVLSPKIVGINQFQRSHTGILISRAMIMIRATTPRPMMMYFIK